MRDIRGKFISAIFILALIFVFFGPKVTRATILESGFSIVSSGNLTVDSTLSSAVFSFIPSVTTGSFTLGNALTTGSMQFGGSSMTDGSTSIYGGTGAGAINLTPGSTGSIIIGSATGTGDITLGSSSNGQHIIIGGGSGSTTIEIANGTGGNNVSIANGSGNDSVSIGTGAGSKTINIGSSSGSSALNLVSGTGGINFSGTVSGISALSYSSQLTSTVATGTAPFVVASTTPVANLTLVNHPKVQSCGTTTSCSNTALSNSRIVIGSVGLSAGSATVSGFSPAFTSSSTFVCTATDASGASAVRVTNASASSITLTGGLLSGDTINYHCIGY